MTQDEEVLGKAYDARLMRRLLGYLRPYRAPVTVSLAAILGGAALHLVPPWLTLRVIDVYIPARDVDGLALIALAFALTMAAEFALEVVQTITLQTTGQRVMLDLRMQIYAHLQRLDIKFFDRNPVGRLMTRLTADVDALNELFTSGVVSVFGDVFALTAIMAAMLLLDWQLALVAFCVLPLVALVTHWFRRHVREMYRTIRLLLARINTFLQEHITGVSTVQLFRREETAFAQFDGINAAHMGANMRSIFYYAVFYPAIEIIAALATALLIWVGGGRVIEDALTLGTLVALLQYSQRFFRPIQDLSEKFNILQAAMASAERVFQLIDTPVEIDDSVHVRSHRGAEAQRDAQSSSFTYGSQRAQSTQRLQRTETELLTHGSQSAQSTPRPQSTARTQSTPRSQRAPSAQGAQSTQGSQSAQRPLSAQRSQSAQGSQSVWIAQGPQGRDQREGRAQPVIAFENVWFAYNHGDWVLKDVSFTVRPGERIGIVGATGAGKTTIISLLLRFYDVGQGRIMLDGVDLRELPLDDVRRVFGLVLQDVHLFSGTIAANVRLGNAGISDDEVRETLRAVSADGFVDRLGGIGAEVVERGATLSVGQKQLLSFARALAFDPAVLVLDEATASIDTETELLIRRALATLMRGRTTIAIAHRLSTIQDMDRVLVFHKGELRESGPHQELLAQRGIYRRLYELQYG